MFAKAECLFHTVRYLRPVQVFGRIAMTFRRVRPNFSPAPAVRDVTGRWRLARWRKASLLSPTRFSFLNEEHELRSAPDWNNPEWPKLWLYNLHYFDDLDAVDAGARGHWHRNLLARWIAENPPPDGNGWEPYCLSLRIVNWCRHAWSGGELSQDALRSLAVQLRALDAQIEVHLLGNHLFENAKALVFGGLFFESPEADRWMSKGVRYLTRELKEQVLPDGGHFERSPMYHNIVTGDVLDLLEADRLAAGRLPPGLRGDLEKTAEAMVTWAELMSHPDGEPSFFNDSAMGIAPTAAVLRTQAEQLGLRPARRTDERLVHLADSGYVRASIGSALLFADVGDIGPDYLPGHAHADTLSCELSLGGRRVLVNSGTSTYAAGTVRCRERGTAAHNTVEVGGQDSSEVWSSFRVARRARAGEVWTRDLELAVEFGASHDGYERLPLPVRHRRSWRLSADELVVRDELQGRASSAAAYWHFHPKVVVQSTDRQTVILHSPASDLWARFEEGVPVVERGEWSREFGCRTPNLRIKVAEVSKGLVSAFTWRF